MFVWFLFEWLKIQDNRCRLLSMVHYWTISKYLFLLPVLLTISECTRENVVTLQLGWLLRICKGAVVVLEEKVKLRGIKNQLYTYLYTFFFFFQTRNTEVKALAFTCKPRPGFGMGNKRDRQSWTHSWAVCTIISSIVE